MALKAILDSVDDLPEDVKSEYTKKKVGDKEVFVLEIEGFNAHPDVAGLKTALEKQKTDNKTLKTENTTLEAKVKDLPDDFTVDEWHRLQGLDVDPNDPDASKKRKEKEDERFANQRKQFEQRIAAVTKEKDDAVAGLDSKLASERGARASERAEAQLSDALAKAGVRPELMKAAKALHKSFVKHEIEDEEMRVFVATDMGEQDIGAYVESWSKSDEGKAFVTPIQGSNALGGGKQANQGGENPFAANAWSKTAQGTILKTDRPKAERLAKSAGFATLDLAIKAPRAITSDKQK